MTNNHQPRTPLTHTHKNTHSMHAAENIYNLYMANGFSSPFLSAQWERETCATAQGSPAGGEGRTAGQLLTCPPIAGSSGAGQCQQRQQLRSAISPASASAPASAAAATDRPDRGANAGAAGQHQEVPGELYAP